MSEIERLREENRRLRQFCSAAASDYAGVMATLEAAVGYPLADQFRKTAKELKETSEFMQLAAEGRADGLIYDDELTQANRRIAELKDELDRINHPFERGTKP